MMKVTCKTPQVSMEDNKSSLITRSSTDQLEWVIDWLHLKQTSNFLRLENWGRANTSDMLTQSTASICWEIDWNGNSMNSKDMFLIRQVTCDMIAATHDGVGETRPNRCAVVCNGMRKRLIEVRFWQNFKLVNCCGISNQTNEVECYVPTLNLEERLYLECQY
jgi:hypothetical protein